MKDFVSYFIWLFELREYYINECYKQGVIQVSFYFQ